MWLGHLNAATGYSDVAPVDGDDDDDGTDAGLDPLLAHDAPPLPPERAIASQRTERGEETEPVRYPLHWEGSVWYAGLMRFRRFVARGPESTVIAEWRCVADTVDGVPCRFTFQTEGYALERGAPVGLPSTAPVGPRIPGADFVEHLRTAHDLAPAPPCRWSTGLCECCDAPAAACECATTYCCVSPCEDDPAAHGFFLRLHELMPALAAGAAPAAQWATQSAKRRPNFSCGVCGIVAYLPLLPLLVVGYASVVALSLLTLCGVPCSDETDECAPLALYPCYFQRRAMVRLQRIPETVTATKLTVICCCPCSELQLWRELRNSGVWPGLMCQGPSDADSAAMRSGVVRARYAVQGTYAVSVGRVPQAVLAADEPCIGYGMS